MSAPGGDALRPASGGGRSFLGVRRMSPEDDGVHLFDDDGTEIGIAAYGETVYVNGRVMSFVRPNAEVRASHDERPAT
jgi:hypothetical protein